MSDLSKAKIHLSNDPILKPLTQKYDLKEYWGGQQNHFLDLIDIVTGQQLSLKAAATIYKRFLELFETSTSPKGDRGPTTKQILEISHEKLRGVGLSNSKANYVKNIVSAVEEGTLDLDNLSQLSDEEITKSLTSIKGLGPWSAEMFLMFSLKRPDIFSIGDLGVRTAISRLYGVDREDKTKMIEISRDWKPYRTYACRFLWASLENA